MHRTTKAVSLSRWALLADSPIHQRSVGRLSCLRGGVMGRMNDEIDVWSKTLVTEGCWEWIGCIDTSGYGRLSWQKRLQLAHRVMYELRKGPIPAGLTLDHLCRNPSCVNPEHLEPVTHRENVLRGAGATAKHARQTHCVRGHELVGHNLIIESYGGRRCRECKRIGGLVRRVAKKKAIEK